MAKLSCESCFFYSDPDATEAACRRGPPVAVVGKDFGLWPYVTKDDWCGEWAGASEYADEPVEPEVHDPIERNDPALEAAGVV